MDFNKNIKVGISSLPLKTMSNKEKFLATAAFFSDGDKNKIIKISDIKKRGAWNKEMLKTKFDYRYYYKAQQEEWVKQTDTVGYFMVTDKGYKHIDQLSKNIKIKKINKSDRKQIFDKYELHPSVKQVSVDQFESGFYKEAIQNAFVEVIDQVKIQSGNPQKNIGNGRTVAYDGDDLMNHVFGCDGKTPLIKFNNLKTSLDKAEQKGIMNLYKGIVGIRDKKAHLNYIQDDPQKTVEYLSLASLLLRLLDEYS